MNARILLASSVLACAGACASDDGSTGMEEPASSSDDGGSTGGTVSASESTGTSSGAADETAAGCVPAGGELVRDEITLEAADGLSLAATVAGPAEGSCLPGVLLIHQFSSRRTQWDEHLPVLVEAGFVVLAIDLRGHGDSDPQPGPFNGLLTDPDQAPLDVAAGLEWLGEHEQVDAARLGVVGTSIGANLSVVALHHGWAAAAVPISPRYESILALAGMPEALSLGDVLCLATDGDGGGAQAQTCTDLVARAQGEAQLEIIEGSSAHGVALLEGFPEVVPQLVEWLAMRLG